MAEAAVIEVLASRRVAGAFYIIAAACPRDVGRGDGADYRKLGVERLAAKVRELARSGVGSSAG